MINEDEMEIIEMEENINGILGNSNNTTIQAILENGVLKCEKSIKLYNDIIALSRIEQLKLFFCSKPSFINFGKYSLDNNGISQEVQKVFKQCWTLNKKLLVEHNEKVRLSKLKSKILKTPKMEENN